MRNLKKILALVLALIMSLSLMATAGAGSFQDVTDDNQYKTAIEVLDALKVIKGYGDGTFKPEGTLNRAEAAVLVYRIATGDVEDKYLGNYTDMAQSNFTDLNGYNWARGYINYCQNAKIVVGTSATTFDPGAKVTGYQLLVMVLRTLGYGKAGEFADAKTWELETAKIAEQEGILKNVTGGDFHSPAPRDMVSEILFQGLLHDTVEYSALIAGGYTKSGETLGKRELGLEGYEAVIVANEWADLNDTDVLDEGKTQVQVKDEDSTRTLSYATELTDIGERRLIYTQNTSKVLYMADEVDGEKLNKVTQGGADVDISSASKFEKVAEMKQADSTEFYVNFDPWSHWVSDYRIEYIIYNEDGELEIDRVIPAGNVITVQDYNNMRWIFATSNGLKDDEDKTTNGWEYGKVFVKTQTKDDISDEISFKTFVKDYLEVVDNDQNWDNSDNGEWVKFVDNNGDGKAEYAFLTTFWLDKAVSSYKKSGETHLIYNFLDEDDDDYSINWLYEDRALGDVVLCTLIDGVAHVQKAEMDTDVIRKVNYKDKDYDNAETVTTDGGEIYEQSGIENITFLPGQIVDMAEKTEYNMYFDAFGYLRAYEETAGKQYALVTEAYYTNHNNSAFVQNWPVTVELAIGVEKGMVDVKEYGLNGGSGNVFVSDNYWTTISGPNGSYYENYLQPAVSGLDGNTVSGWTAPVGGGDYTYWNWNSVTSQSVLKMATITGAFDYGTQSVTGNTRSASFTNVARYVMDGEDNVDLYSAYQAGAYRTDEDEYNWKRPIDYIQLSTADVKAGAREFAIGGTPAYITANNETVNAVHDTQFYIVSEDGVYYFTDYTEVPDINAKTAGGIHAAYAVAQDIRSDRDDVPYWVADVIVYEVESWDAAHYDSVALAYFLASKTTGEVQAIDALDNVTEDAKQTIVPGGRGWNSGLARSFYKVYDQEVVDENNLKASKLVSIGYGEYNANGIYAAVADRVYEVTGRGSYVTLGRVSSGVPTTIDLAPTYEIGKKDANLLNVFDDNGSGQSGIQKNDRLIWVMNGKNVAYIVNLGPDPDALLGLKSVDSTELQWLHVLFNDIYAEEIDYTLTVAGCIGNAESVLADWEAWSNNPTDFDGVAPVSSSDIQAAIDDLNNAKTNLAPNAAETAQINTLITALTGALAEAKLAEAKGAAKLELNLAASEAKAGLNKDVPADKAVMDAVEAAETAARAAVDAANAITAVEAALAEGLTAIAAASVPATSEPIAPTPDVTGTEATVTPTPEQIQGAINGSEDGSITITVETDDAIDSAKVSLEKGSVDKLIAEEIDAKVETPVGNVTVPAEALEQAIEGQENVASVEVVIAETETQASEDAEGNQVDLTGAVVVDVKIVVTDSEGNKTEAEITGLTNHITITIDYTAEDGTAVDVYYVNDAGKLVQIEGAWTVTGNKVTVTTNHLTVFAITEATGDASYAIEYTTADGKTGTDDFAEAMEKVAANGTITLLANVAVDAGYTVDKKMTVNVGEYTLSVSKDIWDTTEGVYGIFTVVDNGDLTLTGNGGTITAKENDSFLVDVRGTGKLTFVDETNSTKFIGNISVAQVNNAGTIIVQGGMFNLMQKDANKNSAFLLNKIDAARDATTISVMGGVFVGWNPGANAAESTDDSTSFLANGYTATELKGVWTVSPSDTSSES